MRQQFLHIELNSDYTLNFVIHDTELSRLWLERMNQRHAYSLDHPDRFYNFNSLEEEIQRAQQMIIDCIDTINHYEKIIERPFTHTQDQDFLNYLHSIFERYHGLLDQQTTAWWVRAPRPVQKALAELNLAVHRCESIHRGFRPRLVCTWFGIPKDVTLPETVMAAHGHLRPPFGSVCLNYAEIGKSLFDLTLDQDMYISDDAFRPFEHYSADFVINFFELSSDQVDKRLEKMQKYYQEHLDFFVEKGYPKFEHVKLLPLQFPVAQLIEHCSRDQLLKDIQQRQYVTRVYIDETSHHSHT